MFPLLKKAKRRKKDKKHLPQKRAQLGEFMAQLRHQQEDCRHWVCKRFFFLVFIHSFFGKVIINYIGDFHFVSPPRLVTFFFDANVDVCITNDIVIIIDLLWVSRALFFSFFMSAYKLWMNLMILHLNTFESLRSFWRGFLFRV